MRQRTEDTLVGYSGVLVSYEVDVRLILCASTKNEDARRGRSKC